MILRLILGRKHPRIARTGLEWFRSALLVGGLLCVGSVIALSGFRSAYQAYESWMFDRTLSRVSAPGSVPPTAPGREFKARLAIERLHISAIVEEGVGDRTLDLAVGHIPSTGYPGEPGNIGLAAHRDTLFRNLKDIRVGDRIALSSVDGMFAYRVVSLKIVMPSDVWVLESSGASELLTLVTCYPFFYVGHAPKRFIVRAERIPKDG